MTTTPAGHRAFYLVLPPAVLRTDGLRTWTVWCYGGRFCREKGRRKLGWHRVHEEPSRLLAAVVDVDAAAAVVRLFDPEATRVWLSVGGSEAWT